MGDNKRNSVAGKVATPKTGGSSPAMQPLADPLETLGKAIGGRIKITTVAPHSQTLEGSLFTADPILNIVAINTRGTTAANQPGDYHIVPVSKIQNFQVLSLPEGDGSFASIQPPIGPIDIRQLKQRQQARIAALHQEEQDRGKGVTREAQAIYDAFKKVNVPIRWHNNQIIVYDSVIIGPPYRSENCKGPAAKPDALSMAKKILEDVRKKLKDKEAMGASAPACSAPTGPRKGG